MSLEKQTSYETVSKWSARDIDFITHFRRELGKVDSDTEFDNEFQQFKLIYKLIGEMNEAIKQEVVVLPEELLPSKEAMYNIDKIWTGGCFHGIIRNEDTDELLERKLYFEHPPNEKKLEDNKDDIVYNVKPVKLPDYRGMIPVNPIKEDNWAIQVRTTSPISVAFSGANYESVILDGKFFRGNAGDPIPKFTIDEFYEGKRKTHFFHRPVYFQITGDFSLFFQRNYNILNMNWQKIITYVTTGGNLDEIEKRSAEELLSRVKI